MAKAPGRSASTSKQARANRANAARSIGPTSAKGKARASRNALHHGLFAAQQENPLLAGRAGKLAARLAAEAPGGPGLPTLAAAIAEKTIELSHIRALRQAAFLSAELRAAAEGPVVHTPETLARLARRYGAARLATLQAYLVAGGREAKDETKRAALALAAGLKRLATLDRYEKRALSARAKLIRRLDAERAPA